METYFRQQAIGANKRVRTRSALIDGAIDVFAEKGFEEASISEIAAVAGLANGTFSYLQTPPLLEGCLREATMDGQCQFIIPFIQQVNPTCICIYDLDHFI